jgi:hypothetical protein
VIEFEHGVLAKVCMELLVWELDPVTIQLREADRQLPAFRQSPDLDCTPRSRRLRYGTIAGDERERYA